MPSETAGAKADGLAESFPVIEGYSDPPSVAPGQLLTLMVSSEEPSFSIDFVRFGAEIEQLSTVADVLGEVQTIPDDAYRVGADWQPSFAWTIPEHWDSGLYGARLYTADGDEFWVPFVVREPTPGTAEVAVLASNYTWQAYNCWGGASYYGCGCWEGPSSYSCGSSTKKPIVSTHRPLLGSDPRKNDSHLAGGDKLIAQWLDARRIDYGMLAESDVQSDPDMLGKYQTLVINVHSEYWTSQMYDALERFLDGGGNLLYLGGNAIHWKITVSGSEMEVQKTGGTHSHTAERGGLWRNLGRNAVDVLGLQYDLAATSAATYAPYTVLEAEHWVFSGTGVAAGDAIGQIGVNHPPDVPGGASGWEMDAVVPEGPAGIEHLARAYNPVRPEFVGIYDEGIGADMIYWEHPGGGGVFSAGSISFTGSLEADPVLSRILLNVLERFGHASN